MNSLWKTTSTCRNGVLREWARETTEMRGDAKKETGRSREEWRLNKKWDGALVLLVPISKSHVIISSAFCSFAKVPPHTHTHPPPLPSSPPSSPSLPYIFIAPIVPQLICNGEAEIGYETWECLIWRTQLTGEQRNACMEKRANKVNVAVVAPSKPPTSPLDPDS